LLWRLRVASTVRRNIPRDRPMQRPDNNPVRDEYVQKESTVPGLRWRGCRSPTFALHLTGTAEVCARLPEHAHANSDRTTVHNQSKFVGRSPTGPDHGFRPATCIQITPNNTKVCGPKPGRGQTTGFDRPHKNNIKYVAEKPVGRKPVRAKKRKVFECAEKPVVSHASGGRARERFSRDASHDN
jgi:hypothetical protein